MNAPKLIGREPTEEMIEACRIAIADLREQGIHAYDLIARQCLMTGWDAAPQVEVQPLTEDEMVARVRALAEKWNSDAIVDGFAGCELAYEVLDILDAPAKPAEVEQQAPHNISPLPNGQL